MDAHTIDSILLIVGVIFMVRFAYKRSWDIRKNLISFIVAIICINEVSVTDVAYSCSYFVYIVSMLLILKFLMLCVYKDQENKELNLVG